MSIEGEGHFFTIYFPGFVCFVLYWAKISGERLQDHWSSGYYCYHYHHCYRHTGVWFIKRKMASSVTPKLEFLKVADNQIRIVTKGPKKTEDRTVTLGDEVEETDPFDNVIKV